MASDNEEKRTTVDTERQMIPEWVAQEVGRLHLENVRLRRQLNDGTENTA